MEEKLFTNRVYLRLTNQCKNNEEVSFQNTLKNEWIISVQIL